MGVTQNVAVTFDNIAINDCYELVNGKIELVVDPNKQLLDVDALVDAVKELLPNVKLFAQNYKGTAEDIESAKYLKQQLEEGKAALLANDSYDTADKNLIQQGYDQQLAGLTYLIENGGSCSAPIDSTTNLVGGRLAAFGATYADVCAARNATIQGAKKTEEGIYSAIWKVLKRCQSNNFAPHNGGLVPKCLWDNNLGVAYLSDPAFIAGFIDGAYLTVSDLFQTAVSASECAICFNPIGTGFYSAKCQDVRNKTIEFFEFFRTLATDGQLRDKVWGDLKQQAAEYLDQTICVQEPICRYNQGKLMFDIASMFVGIGEVSGVVKTGLKAQGLIKVVKAIEKVESKLKAIHRTINGIKWKIVKSSTNTKVYKIASATGIEIGEFSQGILSNLRWKTGSGWIESKVLYGVDYINSTGGTVRNGVLKIYKRTNCRLSANAADDACDWAVEAVGAVIGLAKEIDDVIGKYISKAKFELDGTGPYSRPSNLAAGGHHPLAGKSFEGDNKYIYQEAFSVSNTTLDRISGFNSVHIKRITQNQRALYTKFKNERQAGEKLTIDKMVAIEIKAMTLANVPGDIAVGWVIKALEGIKNQGVTTITNIPWNGLNN